MATTCWYLLPTSLCEAIWCSRMGCDYFAMSHQWFYRWSPWLGDSQLQMPSHLLFISQSFLFTVFLLTVTGYLPPRLRMENFLSHKMTADRSSLWLWLLSSYEPPSEREDFHDVLGRRYRNESGGQKLWAFPLCPAKAFCTIWGKNCFYVFHVPVFCPEQQTSWL